MRKLLKLAGFLATTVLFFFLVVSLAFYHLMRTGEFRRYVIEEIKQKTAFEVQLGEADLEIGRILGISFRDVSMADRGAPAPAIRAERVTARVALWPLLNRRLIFYEVRLKKPEVRLVRDRQGKIPLLERLVNLPFLKQENAQFSVDLRRLKIDEGEIEFADYFSGTAPATTHFHQVVLTLARMRGQALREMVSRWIASTKKSPRGEALQFALAAGVERAGQSARWRAQGKLIFPGETLDAARVWCEIDTRIGGMPASMAQLYGARVMPVKSLGGALDSQLRLEGDLTQHLRVSGLIDFKRLTVDAPELFAVPVKAGDGQLRLDIQWQPRQWEISRMQYRSNDLMVGLKGRVLRAADGDWRLRLNLSAKPLSAAVIKKYLPVKLWASSPIDKLVNAVTNGEVRLYHGGVNATVAEIRRMPDSGFDERLWFDAELRNVSANFPGAYLPLRSINGRIALEKGRFTFKHFRGDYGHSRFTGLDGAYDASKTSPGKLQLRARGEVDLGELGEQARAGILPVNVAKAFLPVQDLGGRGNFDITLKRLADSPVEAEGRLALEGARLQWDRYALTNINGIVALTPNEITTQRMHALISGSPVEVNLGLKNYATDDGMFDLKVDSTGVKAGMVSRLLLGRGSIQDPGIVRGSVRYRGSLNDKQNRHFTGKVELVNVQLATQPLLQPLRQLNGKVSVDDDGVEFQDMNGYLVGFPARASARWRYKQKPQLVFDFAAPDLDISYLISQIDPEATAFYENLEAEGHLALDKARIQNFEFTGLRTKLILDHRVWHFPDIAARADGGTISGPLTVVHKPDLLGVGIESRIQNVPVAAFLRWFDIGAPELTGTLDIKAKIQTSGESNVERKRNMNGDFNLKIADGTIHRMRIVIQLLNVLDLSRWFTLQLPDLSKQGIRFRAITGDFKVRDGVYTTQNLLVDSDDLRMTGAGKIDVPKDEMDFVVAVRPFAGIDTVINYIPLIGRGIAAIKNSFLVASFNVRGDIDDPTITPAPLSTVSEWVFGVLGIPKNIIGFGGAAEKKEPAKDNPIGAN